MASVKMPFGKHRGKRLLSVPTEYLVWLLENNANLDAELKRAVEHELSRRDDAPPRASEPEIEDKPAKAAKIKENAASTSPPDTSRVLSPLGQSLGGNIRMIFRNLALKYHPDRGGSQDAMQALNELHDQVQEVLARTFGGKG